MTGRVGRLGSFIGTTVGGKCVSPGGCTFEECGVGVGRKGRIFLLPRRVGGLRRISLAKEGDYLRRALSTFLFYYCAKLQCSSFIGLGRGGVMGVSKGL